MSPALESKRVLIFGAADDPQVVRVSYAVRKAGGGVCLCDTRAFPGRTRIAFDGERVRLDGRGLPTNIVSAYVRSLGVSIRAPEFARDLKTRPHGLLAQLDECGALLTSLLLCLRERGIPLVNGPEANSQHSRKPYQLQLLRDAGLPVPRFLASNDPKAVKDFVRKVGRAVYKPLAGGATVHEVQRKDLTRERLAALAVAPVLFQELVEGVSVRVYVVGGRAIAAGEIHSPDLDYRRREDTVVATTLSAEERRAAIKAAKVCGMRFSGVDLIRTRRGFVVLECNPSPMFAVFEEKTGLDVAGPLAAYLIAP